MPPAEILARLASFLDRHPVGAAATVVLVNLALKLPTVGSDSLWLDESVSLWMAIAPPSLAARAAHDTAPPLHHVVLCVWGSAFGLSLESARALSAVLSAATAGVLFELARRHFGVATALISAALFLVSRLHFYFAQEARCYALVGLLCVISFLLFLDLFERPSWWRAAALGVVNAALPYAHYVAGFAVAAQLVAAVAVAGRRRAAFLRYAASVVLALALFSPWIAILPWARTQEGAIWIRSATPGQIGWVLRRLVGSGTVLAAYGGITFGALVLGLVRPGPRRASPFAVLVVLLWAFLPVALTYAASLIQPMFVDRYVLYTSLALFLLIAHLIAAAPLTAPVRAAVATALVVLAALPGLTEPVRRPDWRGAVAAAARESAPGTTLVVARKYQFPALAYYLDPDGFRDPAHTLERLARRGVVLADVLGDFDAIASRAEPVVLLLAPDSPLPARDATAWMESRGKRVTRAQDFNGVGLVVLAPRKTG